MATSSGVYTEVLFIDGGISDLEVLLRAVRPGVAVFVLEPGSDGVQQIADLLATHDLTNLSAIQIVSHGAEGELTLGSTVLSDATLPAHADALAEIGQALAP